MASEEPAPRETLQTGDTRSTSAPVGNATSHMPPDTFAVDMALANYDSPATQASFATQDCISTSNEYLPPTGRQGNDNTCETKQTTERTSGVAKENAAQCSTQTNVKVEQPDGIRISQEVPPCSDFGPKEHASTVTETEGTTVKTEGNEFDPSVKIDLPQEPKKITLDKLREVADSNNLAKLEAGVETARRILDSIRIPMADSKQREQVDWLTNIDRLKANSTKTRTVVAVAGPTGAGKSSLLNAVLDEEKMLSTSGYRACTSVITEVSYNEVDDPQKLYRAEVEFISQEDWASELKLLLDDLVEGKQLSPAYMDTNSEAGIAHAKIRAVYPDLTQDMIVKSKAEQLASSESVLNTLGKTLEIACSNAHDLYSKLKVYLDSKDKATKKGPRGSQDMAFWPLIKIVRVYCKADVLSTGLVLVDLPGIHDANAARSAVAGKYMSECSAVWVTAPISRAVDDKSAKDLLGRGSRLQLKLDGIYSNVTFICTMTDAIQLSESMESFDQDGQIQAILSREDELDKAVIEQEEALDQLEHQAKVKYSELEAVDQELNIWEDLQKNKRRGQQVYLPRVPAKRKRSVAATRRRSRPQEEDPDDDIAEQMPPLTTQDIKSKLEELGSKFQIMEDEYAGFEININELRRKLADTKDEKQKLDGESTRCCIQKRNEHVKQAIRVDFAAGIMEIDEEEAQADEESFDPSIKKRDYGEISRSLPVYCISSKAFQQLRGRAKRDTQVQGFKHLVDTEIPLLQEHAKMLPEKGRIHAHKTLLNEFCLLLSSLMIWVTNSALELKSSEMSKQDQSYEMKYLHATVENLKKDLSMMALVQKNELCSIKQNIFSSKSTAATAHASKKLEDIVKGWSMKKTDGGYGLACSTYKAICRRQGSKTKSEKSRNFNDDIAEPYLTKISSGWEQAFCQLIPASLDEFVVKLMQTLKNFHEEMASRPGLQKCKLTALSILEKQHKSHEANIKDVISTMKSSIQAEQRQASRAFQPEIQKEMSKVYSQCAEEAGQGCYLRMKEIMGNSVKKNKNAIYRKTSQRVSRELDKLFESNRKELEKAAHYLVDGLEGNFRMIISSSEIIEASEVARDHIRGVLYDVDSQFEKVLGMGQMDVDPAQSSQPIPLENSDNMVIDS